MLVDGITVIAAESDRDQVQILTLANDDTSTTLVATLTLNPQDEPGRVIKAGDAYFVALRNGGAVARIENVEASGWAVTGRFNTCAAPRGIDFDGDQLWVACNSGLLVRVDPTSGQVTASQRLDNDLRDVVVTDSAIFVSRFRLAEVMILDRAGNFQQRVQLAQHRAEIEFSHANRVANIAYRMVRSGPDQVALTHQLSAPSTPISTTEPGDYGTVDCTGAMVESGVSTVDNSGQVFMGEQGVAVLPVDIAVLPDDAPQLFDGNVAVGVYGAIGQRDETSGPVFAPPFAATVVFSDTRRIGQFPGGCNPSFVPLHDGNRTVSVGYTPNGNVIQQTVNPHRIVIFDSFGTELPGPTTFDTGHELFFGDTGGGIACASCHAEGGDDGLVWNFAEFGPRRTQELRGGIMDSVPFHWVGDMENLTTLAAEVMRDRMSGPDLPPRYVTALALWMDSLAFPPKDEPVDATAVARGREIFESRTAQCTTCHFDDRLSGPGSFDVGTGIIAQVPGLVGVSLRAPFIHTGCAETLRDRFNPDCGGSNHGSVDHLDEAQLSDLVAYLESL